MASQKLGISGRSELFDLLAHSAPLRTSRDVSRAQLAFWADRRRRDASRQTSVPESMGTAPLVMLWPLLPHRADLSS